MPPRSFALPSVVRVAVILAWVFLGAEALATLVRDPFVGFSAVPGGFQLASGGRVAPLSADPRDHAGVLRAVNDLRDDLTRVTGVTPKVIGPGSATGAGAVIIGTIGRNDVIDRLIREGKLDAGPVAGKWESFLVQVVDAPAPGLDRALVIAGSDKRGTIYGIYELSEEIGVSPWYWWADVPAARHDTLFVKPGRAGSGPPAVKYRGLFLNDEAPDLTNWVRAKFGRAPVRDQPPVPTGIANYGHEFYGRIFELMLRLRANYLWPAMWNNAFNEDDPDNARLADDYGIVMGTSHQEPMQRAQKEWDRRYLKSVGTWNYAQHPDLLQDFWREGVRRNRPYENIYTLGLRGANDTEMAPGGPAANRALLEKIVEVQRRILGEEISPDLARVPQMWCLYKEVQEFYEHGMRAPDDVTLLWAEDNWGNLRRLPTATERTRRGGAGIYYHFDYHGGPRSYQWLNTSPLPKIWEQMSLARQYGADRIWIVNAGHLKGYEFPLEFFLDLAWDPERWSGDNLDEFARRWAAREFGPAQAADIADLMAKYSKYNGRRKPELLAPDTYSLVDYREAETVVADYRSLAVRAVAIENELPASRRDAFHQLVGFPVRASAIINQLYFAAGRNALYARQGRGSAGDYAGFARAEFANFLALVDDYNGAFAGGKWAHFMDQPVLGYTTWRDPPKNNLDHLKLLTPPLADGAGVGVAVEGRAEAVGAAGRLPRFDSLNRQRSWFEVFGRGRDLPPVAVTANVPWIVLTPARESKVADPRYWVDVDWARLPPGLATGEIAVVTAGKTVTTIAVEALNAADVARENLQGFAEGQGYVSIEPEHFTGKTAAGAMQWMRIADYGRTLSGMRAEAPVDAPAVTPGADSPCLEYQMYLFTTGPVEVTAITAPTLNFMPGRGVRYGVSFDDQAAQVVTLVPPGYQAKNGNPGWEKSVSDNAHYGRSTHTIAQPGYHTLKVWMVDPAVVMQKLIVNLGGLHPSYLGPPESFRGPAPAPDPPARPPRG